MKVVTFNIHHGRGLDRRVRIARVGSVLESLEADIICLQEVDAHWKRSGNIHQAEALAEQLDMDCCFGPALKQGRSAYGNAILSRFPLQLVEVLELPPETEGKESRNAMIVTVDNPRGLVTVLNTHLGLSRQDRRDQSRTLADWFEGWRMQYPEDAFLFCGDLNGGPRLNGSLAAIFQAMAWSSTQALPGGLRATFPSFRPFRKLDYILESGPLRAIGEKPYRSGLSFAASDHLPLFKELEWKE